MKPGAILFGGADTSGILPNISLLVGRCVVGLSLAFAHGIGKIPPSERFVARVESLGFPVPEVFAFAAGISEFFGGLLLAVGLLTRPSAFFIFLTMLVVVFVRHANDPFGGSKELGTLYAGAAFLFLVLGSGRFGLDALLRRK